ncbi:MAG: tetratricopeptide repeat protein [Candidatus Neomarinimicrobiota bacterium]
MKRPLASGIIGYLLVAGFLSFTFPVESAAAGLGFRASVGENQEQTTKRTRRPTQRNNNAAQDIRTLKARVAALKVDNDSLKARVGRLERRLQIVNNVLPELQATLKSVATAKAAMDSSELAMVNQLSLILNKISLLEDKATYVDSTNFEILSQLVLLENKIVSLTSSFNDIMAARERSSAPETAQMSDEEFRGRYVEALTDYQNGQFREAGNKFASLLQSGSQHELADNSQYWLAECFYDLKNYRRAIGEFEKVYQFKDSDKKDDAQYKIALSYLNAGNREQAQKEFQRLLDEYPDSVLREKARRYLR